MNYESKDIDKKFCRERANIHSFPNFHKSGSIRGIKQMYYGKDALLVRYGDYIYNVTSCPEIYNEMSY